MDSGLKNSTSRSHELLKEQEVNFENQRVEDSPKVLGTCDSVHREEAYFEDQTVEETPTKLSACDRVHGGVNVVNLIVVDSTPTELNVVDTPTESSSCDEPHKSENLTGEDNPTKSFYDQICNEHEVNLENLVVEDTPPEFRICDVRL